MQPVSNHNLDLPVNVGLFWSHFSADFELLFEVPMRSQCPRASEAHPISTKQSSTSELSNHIYQSFVILLNPITQPYLRHGLRRLSKS